MIDFTRSFKKLLGKTAIAFSFSALAVQAQAADIATFDANLEFDIDLLGGLYDFTLAGDGGTATLDDNGRVVFAIDLFYADIDLGLAGFQIGVDAEGDFNGTLAGNVLSNTGNGYIELAGSCGDSGAFDDVFCPLFNSILGQPLDLGPGSNLDDPIVLGLNPGDETSILLLEVSNPLANIGVYLELSNPQAVPVPAAAWLFGSALLGLAGVRRRS